MIDWSWRGRPLREAQPVIEIIATRHAGKAGSRSDLERQGFVAFQSLMNVSRGVSLCIRGREHEINLDVAIPWTTITWDQDSSQDTDCWTTPMFGRFTANLMPWFPQCIFLTSTNWLSLQKRMHGLWAMACKLIGYDAPPLRGRSSQGDADRGVKVTRTYSTPIVIIRRYFPTSMQLIRGAR